MKKAIKKLRNNSKIRKGFVILLNLYKIYTVCKEVMKVAKLLMKLIKFIF